MSEADRVFARMTPAGSHSAPENKELLHIAPRRRGMTTGQSRVVEVVHRHSDRSADAPRRERSSTHAASWPEGFQARSAPVPPPPEAPTAASEPAPPVGHVMPGWEPLLPPIDPAATQAVPAAPQRQPKASAVPKTRERAFADPFAAEDTGANCFRCGYLVEPAREKRGLMTCAACG
jgi:hypothetical protein